jgi:hypothetical protein
MSTHGNAKFPMPEVVNSPRSPYAPRAGQIVEDKDHFHAQSQAVIDLSANIPTGVDAIKGWLKTLTHRQMREFVAEVFAAHKKLHGQADTSILAPAITSAQLADVLDAVAHAD